MTGKRQKTYAWNSLPQNPCISAEEIEDQHDKTVTESYRKLTVPDSWLQESSKAKRHGLWKRKVLKNFENFLSLAKVFFKQGYKENFERMSGSGILQGNTAALCSPQMCRQTSAKRGNSQFGDHSSLLTALRF